MAKGKYEEYLTEEGLLKLEGWARDGLIDEQIAEKIGIRRETLYDWKKKYPNISNALKAGKEIVDRKVENALLKRALGYEYVESKYAMVAMEENELYDAREDYIHRFKMANPEATDDDIRRERESFMPYKKVLIEEKTKEVSPDANAAKWWLMNRKPDVWRDRQHVQHDGTVKIDNPFTGLTDEQLRKLADDDG